MELREYPFWNYINEDKSHYPHAKDNGYHDPTDSFLIGESGGFLLNINPKYRFVNTHLLTPAANEFEKNGGKYTLFNEDSIPHINFRKQETIRRMVGYKAPCKLNTETGEVEDLYITGEHYNFINYGRILKLDTKTLRIEKGKVTGKKILGFPRFIDCQWWYFIIKQFCKDNGFFLINDKTRRGGFSYMEAIGSANYINLVPNRSVIHAAADNKFLIQSGGLSDFMKKQIIFYESHTPFARGIAKIDSSDFILGFKDQSTGVVDTSSWNSACISVSTNNNPSAAVGKDAGEIKCEEMSEFENFDDFMDVTTPTLKTGSVLTGFLNAWGTAGKANKGWAVFEQNFYDPRSGSFMPFENVWDKDSRDSVCGYFKPYCWGLEGYKISEDSSIANLTSLDKDGNSDVALGFKIAEEERAAEKKNSKSFSKYISYCGQYANMPAESFSSVTENIFSSEILDEWEQELRISNDYKFYTDGLFVEYDNEKFEFMSNARIATREGAKFNHDYFDYIKNVPRHSNEDPHGCIRIFFRPISVVYTDKKSNTPIKGCPPGVYSISYDPVGIDKDKGEITNKHSHNSIKVWMNPCIYNGYKTKLCATYYGRPNTLEEADRICYNLARMYNCIGTTNVETNRGETISNFKKWKALRYLGCHPVWLWDTSIKNKISTTIGYNIGNNQVKLDGLRMLKEMLYTVIGKRPDGRELLVLHTIYDHPSVLELKKWNETGNFDRVSEMIVRGIEWAANDKFAENKMKHRKKVDTQEDNFWTRPRY